MVEGDSTPCATLGLHFVLGPHPEIGSALRLARDARGEALLLTAEEAAQRKSEAAERKIAELEAELRRRG